MTGPTTVKTTLVVILQFRHLSVCVSCRSFYRNGSARCIQPGLLCYYWQEAHGASWTWHLLSFWHNWPQHPVTSAAWQVWSHWHCTGMAPELHQQSFSICQAWKALFSSSVMHIRRATRVRTRPYFVCCLHLTDWRPHPQFRYSTSPVCWRHSGPLSTTFLSYPEWVDSPSWLYSCH